MFKYTKGLLIYIHSGISLNIECSIDFMINFGKHSDRLLTSFIGEPYHHGQSQWDEARAIRSFKFL